jgi:hypothetical protein
VLSEEQVATFFREGYLVCTALAAAETIGCGPHLVQVAPQAQVPSG